MKKELIDFSIERLDPLGQGVSKVTDKITFIQKVLPGEKGKAIVTGKKKGVQFAQVKELTEVSELRIEPECEHWNECSGCSYLHTNYQTELANKLSSFERALSFSAFSESKVQLHNGERFNYRNRIQLHYDLDRELIGFFKGGTNKIHSIKNCIVCHPQIQEEIQNFKWIEEVPPNAPSQGHVELYLKDGEVKKTWNENYSSGGFSQVNSAMNDKALELWNSFYLECGKPEIIFDVFGGSGNLSRQFSESKVTVVDSFCDTSLLLPHQEFLKQNLYKNSNPPEKTTDFLLLDPPRSGFKEAVHWIEKLNPKFLGYQSCFSDTMLRDLKELPDSWAVHEIHLLDFFPGTHHFESIIFLKNT